MKGHKGNIEHSESVLKNRELVLYLIIHLAVSILLLVLAVSMMEQRISRLHRETIRRSAVVIAAAAKKNGIEEAELAELFTRYYFADDAGVEKLSSSYGIAEDLPLSLHPQFDMERRRIIFLQVLLFSVFSFFSGLLLFCGMRILYRNMRLLRRAAEKMSAGEFISLPSEFSSGDLAQLFDGFNRLSRRMQVMASRLEDEKNNLENLIADISHQLKTPMASVKLMNDLVLSGETDRERSRDYLEKSIMQIERMEGLIKVLLSLARMEAGAMNFKIEEEDICRTISKAAADLKALAEDEEVDLRLNCSPAVFPHDRQWMSEAVGNIMKNCIEHSPPGSRVEVTLEDGPILLRIRVSDQGRGIPKDELPFIFDRFFRGKSLNSQGTGIGLSLAKAVVEAHGGTVGVSSTPGRGSSFLVLLERRNLQKSV